LSAGSIRKIILAWLLNIAVTGLCYAQAPDYRWFKTYGGDSFDNGECVVQTDDGGFIMAGYSYDLDSSNYNALVVKTDSLGNIIWQKLYGGSGDDSFSSIQPTSDGGYIIAGGTESSTSEGDDIYLVKTDAGGTVEWQSIIGGRRDEHANSVIPTSDGNYLLVGLTTSYGAGYEDIYVVKTDDTGELIWSRTFGGSYFDKAFMVRETVDGNYVFVAGIDYYALYPPNTLLAKMNPDGDTIWTSVLGGNSSDACNAFVETADGGFMLVGWTMSYTNGEADYYLIKTDQIGQEEWYKHYGGIDRDIGRGIDVTEDGGYIVTGYTTNYGAGADDIYTIKIDINGDSLWATTFGGAEMDQAMMAIQCTDGGYAVFGGTRSMGNGPGDMILIKYNGEQTGISDNGLNLPVGFVLHQNYPNPFNGSTVISFTVPGTDQVSLKIFDLLGREVAQLVEGVPGQGQHQMTFNAADLASGIYVYRLQAGGRVETKKMILVK
jgi:hypothetical protein